MNREDRHNKEIFKQFTKQSVTFSKIPGHSGDVTLNCLREIMDFSKDDTVLDVACGPGILACAIAPLVKHVAGIDLVPAMIEQAELLQEKEKISNVEWTVGNVMPLPYHDDAFSIAVTRYSFHHLLKPGAVFKEMARVVKPHGKVAVIDVFSSSEEQSANYDSLEKRRDPSHVHTLTLASLRDIFESAGVSGLSERFYRVEIELEQQMKALFQKEAEASKVREAVIADIGKDRLGWGAHYKNEEVYLSYPIAVIVGEKRGA